MNINKTFNTWFKPWFKKTPTHVMDTRKHKKKPSTKTLNEHLNINRDILALKRNKRKLTSRIPFSNISSSVMNGNSTKWNKWTMEKDEKKTRRKKTNQSQINYYIESYLYEKRSEYTQKVWKAIWCVHHLSFRGLYIQYFFSFGCLWRVFICLMSRILKW